MEGLIPLVYKKMKRNSVRRTYTSLSHSHSPLPSYNIHDFYYADPDPSSKNINTRSFKDEGHHRRRNSMPDQFMAEKPAHPSPTLTRFRSQRMFGWGCVNAA